MPIHFPVEICNLSKLEFDAVDKIVMRCAYDTQNSLGRLCDEQVYETDLAIRLRAEGMADVHTQLPVTVAHGSFEKTYRLDLVADHAVYELKTVAALAPIHDSQAIHYAMLVGICHCKLLNFRSTRVQDRLRFNAVTPADRLRIAWDTSQWQRLSAACTELRNLTQDIICDWGSFLEYRLYSEALLHFCGGEAKCTKRVPVIRDGVTLGKHRVQCHADDMFFFVTALNRELAQYSIQLRRLLQLTGFKAAQWVNINHATVQFITVR